MEIKLPKELQDLLDKVNGKEQEEDDPMELHEFNLEKVFDEQVNPLIRQAAVICKKAGIPFIFTMTIKSEADGFTQATMIGLKEHHTPQMMLAIANAMDASGQSQDRHYMDENGNEVDLNDLQ